MLRHPKATSSKLLRLQFALGEQEEYRSSGVQEFKSSGVQEFRSSGVQEFRRILNCQ
jgi:hypothetical protein